MRIQQPPRVNLLRTTGPWPATFLFLGLSAPAEEAPAPDPNQGTFEELAEPIGKLLRLRWEGGALRLERDEKDQRVQEAFQEIGVVLHADVTGEKNDEDTAKTELAGGGLQGLAQWERRSLRILLREEKGPRRALDVWDDGEGELRIVLADPAGKQLLFFQQGRGNGFHVADFRGEAPFAARGDSFLSFYRAHRRYVEGQLLPFLAKVGVTPPLTSASAEVKQAVFAGFPPPGDAELAQVHRALQQLGDENYAKREEATEFLAKNFGRYMAQIEEALKDASISAEASGRLRKVMDEHATQRSASSLAASLGLAEDAEYLIGLLPEAPEPSRLAIGAALERMTQQKFGADADAWRRWWAERKTR